MGKSFYVPCTLGERVPPICVRSLWPPKCRAEMLQMNVASVVPVLCPMGLGVPWAVIYNFNPHLGMRTEIRKGRVHVAITDAGQVV